MRGSWDQLRAWIRRPPRFDFVKAVEIADVIELVKSQVTERDACSQDLFKWCEEIDTCFIGFEKLDEEEQTFLVKDVGEDMLIQLSTIDYCIETFEELLLEEREE